MLNVQEFDKWQCCGCEACKAICPSNAIIMEEDSEGFLYPRVDENKCVRCKRCVETCGFNNVKPGNEILKCYAGHYKDVNVVKESQSGAAFVALSDVILNDGGIIFGTKYNVERKCAEVVCADNQYERDKMRKSKYIQSKMGNCYNKMVNRLNDKQKVLFVGTPCQVAGVLSYFDKQNVDTKNFFAIDIICHGVPSPKIWRENLREAAFKENATEICFRDKNRLGWHSHEESYCVGKVKKYDHTYTNLFYSHYILRPSCYNCNYCNMKRVSDITIGDCWGLEKQMPVRDTNRGESIVIINTRKGSQLYKKVEEAGKFDDLEIDIRNYKQPNLLHPSKMPSKRSEFWSDYSNRGYRYIRKKYGRDEFKTMLKRIIAQIENFKLWKV